MNYAIPTMGKKMKKDVDSNFYFNNPDKIKEMETYCDVTPVDMNGAFVPVKGEDNLKKTQENIRRRFDLGGES